MFTQAGAEVVGISNDQPEALVEFATSQRLNFPLLSDEGGKLRKGLKVKGAADISLSKDESWCAHMRLSCFHLSRRTSCHSRHATLSNCSERKAEQWLCWLSVLLACCSAMCSVCDH